MSILTAFNTQVQNLIDDLKKLYPNEKDINLFREKFKLVKFANPRIIIENFIVYVYPYKEFIMNKNEKYFIEEDNSINRECDKNEISLTKVINFKKLWEKTSDKNKDAIWKYFQVLIILAERWFKENAINK
mgnify:FL=1|jgi:hypothetical protein